MRIRVFKMSLLSKIENAFLPKAKLNHKIDFSKRPKNQKFWSWIWFLIKPSWLFFTFMTTSYLVRRVFWFLPPLFLASIVHSIETGVAFEDPWQAWKWVVIFGSGAFFVTLMLWMWNWISRWIGQIVASVSTNTVSHLLGLSVDWHELTGSGNKMQRLMTARKSLETLNDLYFWDFVPFVASFIAAMISVYALDIPAEYILIFTLLVVTYGLTTWCFRKALLSRFDGLHSAQEGLVGSVFEFLRSIPTLITYGLQKHVLKNADEHEVITIGKRIHVSSSNLTMWIVINCVGCFWVVLTMVLGLSQALAGDLSVAGFFLVVTTSYQVWSEAERFPHLFRQFMEAKNGVMRLIKYFDKHNEVSDSAQTANNKLELIKAPSIKFDQIDFNYNEKVSVFKGLDLDIKAGEKVGVVGSSGAGKTTLVKLLCRFYDPQKGNLKINDENIKQVSLASLRENIAIIPQDIELFNHPLIENIRYGRLDASDEEVWEAVRQSYAQDFIESLPEGINTYVGERGVKLSGGQRQRIAVARAILKDAPILILDEATSALDSESEAFIKQSLESLMKDKTVIAIAHRLSTLEHMDRIVVMEHGKIIEQGRHSELIAKKDGLYAKLWSMQSGNILKNKVA